MFISQVTTEPEFLTRSAELQEALGSGNVLNYCQNKIQQVTLPSEKMLWQFLKVRSLKAGSSELFPQSQVLQPLSTPISVNSHPVTKSPEALTHPWTQNLHPLLEAQRPFMARK